MLPYEIMSSANSSVTNLKKLEIDSKFGTKAIDDLENEAAIDDCTLNLERIGLKSSKW